MTRHAMNRPVLASILMASLVLALLPGPTLAQQTPDPDHERLAQRLRSLDADPARNAFASFERLQARTALAELAEARSRQRPNALQVAEWRVETAETAVRTEAIRQQIEQLDRDRSDLLVEASRREAARARAEAERLRIQTQIQAEEAARLRQAAEEEAQARAEAETVLEGVSSREAARLRAARQRAAELARQEAELLKSLESGSKEP